MIALNQTLIHCRNTEKHEFQAFPPQKTLYSVPQLINQILKSKIWTLLSSSYSVVHFRHLYALESYTCKPEIHKICVLMLRPHPLGSSKGSPMMMFSQEPCSCRSWTSSNWFYCWLKSYRNLNFQTFCTNLTHFYYEFLKDFYIFWTSGDSRIHPVLAEKNIAPR